MEDISEEIIRVVSHIKEIALPEQIILFGSAVRGTMGPDSDLDILIIKSGDYNPRELAGEIYLTLKDVNVPVDLLIVTPDLVKKHQNDSWSVLHPALLEGRVMYERGVASI